MNRAAPRRPESRPRRPPGDGEVGDGEGSSGDDGEDGSPPEERRGEVDAMAWRVPISQTLALCIFFLPLFLLPRVICRDLVWSCGGELVCGVCFARDEFGRQLRGSFQRWGREVGWPGWPSEVSGAANFEGASLLNSHISPIPGQILAVTLTFDNKRGQMALIS
jgi:hypothetical protein